MKFFILIQMALLTYSGFGQTGKIKIAISRDTVLLGNAFYLLYTFDLKDAQFKTPEIRDGEIIGQSTINNTSFIDGELKAMHSQRFLIQPSHTGVFIVPTTTIKSGGEDIEVPSVQIYVKENPSNLEVDPEEGKDWQTRDIFSNVKTTPGRKTKKI